MARVSAKERSLQFVQAAARVIARDGAAAATTRRIATEADAPLAALHYCFRSKDELLEEVYRYLSADYARALPPLPMDAGIEATITQHAHRIWNRMLTEPHEQVTTFELLLRRYRLNADEQENALAVNRTLYAGWLDSTADLFRRGAENSGLGEGIDFDITARFFVATIDGVSMQHLSDPDEARSDLLIEALIAATIAMVRAGGPTAQAARQSLGSSSAERR